jgi:hypothetical protein
MSRPAMSSTAAFSRVRQTGTRPSSQTYNMPTSSRISNPPAEGPLSRPCYGGIINQATLQPWVNSRCAHPPPTRTRQRPRPPLPTRSFSPIPNPPYTAYSRHDLANIIHYTCNRLAPTVLRCHSFGRASSRRATYPQLSHPQDLPLIKHRKENTHPTTCTRNLISLFWLHLWLH